MRHVQIKFVGFIFARIASSFCNSGGGGWGVGGGGGRIIPPRPVRIYIVRIFDMTLCQKFFSFQQFFVLVVMFVMFFEKVVKCFIVFVMFCF